MNGGCPFKFGRDFNRFMECEIRVFLTEQGKEVRSDKQGQNEIVRNFRYTFTTKITFGWKFQNKMKSAKCMFPSKLHVHLRKIFHV